MHLAEKAAALSACEFLGVPVEDFEEGGREQLSRLLPLGLKPDSRVLDIGCGVLRGGYWLIHFLDAGCYCGIEPHRGRLDIGRYTMLEREVLACKRPRFDTNSDFDTAVFRERFDFFLAYSIWTHASKRQIRVMLDGFLRDTHPAAQFVTSYLPADDTRPDYDGDGWVGTSHESTVPGCIAHRTDWIDAECASRNLRAFLLGRDRTQGQTWLRIAASGAR